MLQPTISALLVDDDEDDFIITENLLRAIPNMQLDIIWCSSFEAGKKRLSETSDDLYLFDFLLGQQTAIDLIHEAQIHRREAPIILLTGRNDEKLAYETLRLGASDYLIKSELTAEMLQRSIRYSLERATFIGASRKSETRYRKIFEESGEMLFVANLEGRIIDTNPSATRLTGYSQLELRDKWVTDLIDNGHVPRKWADIPKLGEFKPEEVRVLTKNGERKLCLLSAALENDGAYIHGRISDVSAQKQTERERLFSEKSAVTGRLVQLLAHEVRNPLTNITLAAEQLESETVDENLTFYTQIIRRNGNRINELITQLLQSARPGDLTLAPGDLLTILGEALKAAKDRIDLKKIKVTTIYHTAEVMIPLDATSLQLAFLNIINNATEAVGEEDGFMKIETRQKDNDVQVLISDNGTGISEENMAKVFEPYYTRKKTGMGLGLATTLSIIHLHNGRIDVQSETGIGTTFTVSFRGQLTADGWY